MSKADKLTKPKPPRLMRDPCEPVECANLQTKLEYCWQYLLLWKLIDDTEATRIQSQIDARVATEPSQ